jgi:GDP-D-mannose dehydratase
LVTEITTTFRDFVKITFAVLGIEVEFKGNRFNEVGDFKIPVCNKFVRENQIRLTVLP